MERKGSPISFRNREIESKLLVYDTDLDTVNAILRGLYAGQVSKSVFGSSVDTYWAVSNPDVEADFIRMRERDGIRQITVKGKDRGDNLNRLEIDVDSTSDVGKITRLLTAAHGKPSGRVGKTYYVYWLVGESEHTTVCCYSVQSGSEGTYPHTVVEVETTNRSHMLELEAKVLDEFRRRGYSIERAPGSLYEMFVTGTATLLVNNNRGK